MTINNKDYVAVIYNEQDRPLTDYPAKLSRYLFNRFGLKSGDRLLEVGCGRGEFLSGFIQCGAIGSGVDQSEAAKTYCPNATLKLSDIENDGIPFEDNSFDVVYSKSVIEHFYYPKRMVKEIYRVLKPGGVVISPP
jgi:ubiquinone/menaquinone biosynthesis C-methylase UbiE